MLHLILLLTRWILSTVFIVGLNVPAGAATFTVTTTADSGTDSLRAVIASANLTTETDIINFSLAANSTIILTGGQIEITKPVTIDGSGVTGLIVKGSSGNRVFQVSAGIAAQIKFLTLESIGSSSILGGIIYNNGGALELVNCTIQNSHANQGAIYNYKNVTYNGTLTVDSCIIKNNVAEFGAGVFNDGGTVNVSNCTFENNGSSLAGTGGGGIKNSTTGILNIVNSTFSGNQADIGGGIVNSGTLTVNNSTFFANKAINTDNREGGAIDNKSGATSTIINSTFSANTAGWLGGAIANFGTTNLIHVTLTENNVTDVTYGKGGGIYNDTGGILTVANSIISANSIMSTNTSPEIHNSGSVTVQGKNVIGFNGGSGIYGTTLNASTYSTPAFGAALTTLLGALQNNGGLTQTRAPTLGGLAHNTGDNTYTIGLSFDQRGEPRISAGTVDIGAVEIAATTTSFTLTVTAPSAGIITGTGINCSADCTETYTAGTLLTLTAVPNSGYMFTSWSGCIPLTGYPNQCQVTLDADKNVTALFAPVSMSLTVIKSGIGAGTVTSDSAIINCDTSCAANSATFSYGTAVTLTATAASGATFTGWSGACSGTGACFITMDAAKTVTAHFIPTYALTVSKTGSGDVNSIPTGIDCGAQCVASFDSDSIIALNANPATGFTFTGWSGACSGTGACSITMNTVHNVGAHFTANHYVITATADPIVGGSINCSPNPVTYNGTVNCTAVPNSGYTFTQFSGDCSGTICALTNITTNKTVTAHFTLNSIPLTVIKNGTGSGIVTSAAAEINCGINCAANFESGSSITLTATPTTGSLLSGWSGCIPLTHDPNQCDVTLTTAQTVTATFRSAITLALNDTGINTCGNTATNNVPCPVAGFPGQDAEYGNNQFNFTKLDLYGAELAATATNHACVRDNVTGLIWEIKTKNSGSRDAHLLYTWEERLAYVQTVNAMHLCGFSDWRVPDIKELTSIVNYQHSIPKPASVSDYFSDFSGALFFWSESTSIDMINKAWFLYFTNGVANYGDRSKSYHLRLVRGAQTNDTFIEHGDGTISQTNTGLMWAKCSEGQSGSTCAGTATTLNWEQALTTADNAHLAGYSDWRLPNIKELQALIDYKRAGNPKLDPSYFPNTPAAAFWSSTPFALYARYAWYLYADGYLGSHFRTKNFHVRLVRNQ
jgi:Fe-S cluster biogenesis protein NfuA